MDALLDMVEVGSPVDGEAPGSPPSVGTDARQMVAAVARGARPGQAARAIVGSAPQRLEGAFHNLLDSILRHPEVRRLEASWRGLRLLVEHCDARAGVEVDVVNAGADGVAAVLSRLADADGTRAPVDLLVVDQHLGPTAIDMGRLDKWAGLAQVLLAPIVVAGHASMLGVDSLDRCAQSTAALSTSDDGRAVAVRSIAAHEAARWVTVVVNDPLVRAPYTSASSRQQEPPFEEDVHDAGAYVFTSGAYVVAAVCARSQARVGWPTSITGARDGVVGNLPVHTVTDHGHDAAIPLEVAPSEDAVKEAAKAGLTMLACAPNSDAAIVARAPVLHRPAGGNGAAHRHARRPALRGAARAQSSRSPRPSPPTRSRGPPSRSRGSRSPACSRAPRRRVRRS